MPTTLFLRFFHHFFFCNSLSHYRHSWPSCNTWNRDWCKSTELRRWVTIGSLRVNVSSMSNVFRAFVSSISRFVRDRLRISKRGPRQWLAAQILHGVLQRYPRFYRVSSPASFSCNADSSFFNLHGPVLKYFQRFTAKITFERIFICICGKIFVVLFWYFTAEGLATCISWSEGELLVLFARFQRLMEWRLILVEMKRIGRKMVPYIKEDYLLVFLIRLQIIYRTIDRIQIQKCVYKYV